MNRWQRASLIKAVLERVVDGPDAPLLNQDKLLEGTVWFVDTVVACQENLIVTPEDALAEYFTREGYDVETMFEPSQRTEEP